MVVSVHSPKFPTEKETPALRQAVLRHRITHPVLNDRDFGFWKQFGARAWPTLFFHRSERQCDWEARGGDHGGGGVGFVGRVDPGVPAAGAAVDDAAAAGACGGRWGGAVVPGQGALRRGKRAAVRGGQQPRPDHRGATGRRGGAGDRGRERGRGRWWVWRWGGCRWGLRRWGAGGGALRSAAGDGGRGGCGGAGAVRGGPGEPRDPSDRPGELGDDDGVGHGGSNRAGGPSRGRRRERR